MHDPRRFCFIPEGEREREDRGTVMGRLQRRSKEEGVEQGERGAVHSARQCLKLPVRLYINLQMLGMSDGCVCVSVCICISYQVDVVQKPIQLTWLQRLEAEMDNHEDVSQG